MNDEQAIRTLIATWLAATAAGDVDKVLALMSPDAVFLTAGHPPMRGRRAFEQGLRTVLATHSIEANSEVEEVSVAGDMAYSVTRLSVAMTSRNGGTPVRRSGNTLSVYRKGADGSWLLTRDANMLGAPG